MDRTKWVDMDHDIRQREMVNEKDDDLEASGSQASRAFFGEGE